MIDGVEGKHLKFCEIFFASLDLLSPTSRKTMALQVIEFQSKLTNEHWPTSYSSRSLCPQCLIKFGSK